MEDDLLYLFNQNLANEATDLYDQRQRDLVNQAAMNVFQNGFNNRNNGIMQQASRFPLYDDMAPIIDTSYGVANEPDEEEQYEVDQFGYRKEPEKQSNGIMDLLISMAIPGYGFFKNIGKGGLDGIKSLNQRLRQSDFGQAKNLADYFDMRSYGGLREREKQRAETMAQARGIQKGIDRGDFDGPDREDRDRDSVTEKSAGKSKGVGGGGYTKSDDVRESYRG